jgi:hypothetical protein
VLMTLDPPITESSQVGPDSIMARWKGTTHDQRSTPTGPEPRPSD